MENTSQNPQADAEGLRGEAAELQESKKHGGKWWTRRSQLKKYRYKVPAHITLYDTMVTLSLSHMIRLELSIG